MGCGMGARMFVGYVFMCENMRNQDVSKVTIYMFTLDSLSIFVTAMYFRFISKDWRFIFGAALIVLSCSAFAMYQQTEPPKFYYSIGDYEMTRKVLT
jgi:drug/metabolite transporter (DMT)-like permease